MGKSLGVASQERYLIQSRGTLKGFLEVVASEDRGHGLEVTKCREVGVEGSYQKAQRLGTEGVPS